MFILLGLATGQRALTLLGVMVWGALLVARLLVPQEPRRLRLALAAPIRTELGQRSTHAIDLHNDADGWTPRTELRFAEDLFEGVAISVPPLPPSGHFRVEVSRLARARGVVEGVDVVLDWTEWTGLRRAQASRTVDYQLIVHPRTVDRTAPKAQAGDGLQTAWQVDRSGSEPYALREWRSGEPTRHVHWRGSARRGRLVVIEHAAPRGKDLLLLVVGDGVAAMSEDLVTEVASLAVSAAREGRSVTLGGSQTGLSPQTGGTVTDLLDWCARIATPSTPRVALMDALMAGMTRGGLVRIAVAGTMSDSWWSEVSDAAGRCGVDCAPLDATFPELAQGSREPVR